MRSGMKRDYKVDAINKTMIFEVPEISIVVPVYRVEKYLEECVESIINQTFSKWELILVDDGSPDSCPELCEEIAKRDLRIKVIHQENGGLSNARNTGVRNARGKYICFIDSDDIVAPTYCEILHQLLKDSTYDFSVCAVKRFEDGDKPQEDKNKDETKVISNEEYLGLQLKHKTEFGVWNKLYRKEIFDFMEFEPEKIHEDVIWSAELADNFHDNIIMSEKQLYYYRQREGGIVSNMSIRCSSDRIYAGKRLIQITEKNILNYLMMHYATPFNILGVLWIRYILNGAFEKTDCFLIL